MAALEHDARRGDKASQCRLHLIDLKRAGHSPTRTELNVPRGSTAKVSMPDRALLSSVSSSAGW